MASITQPFTRMHSPTHIGVCKTNFRTYVYIAVDNTTLNSTQITIFTMADRYEIFNSLQEAMQPLAHWYQLIDIHTMMDIQADVIHEVIQSRSGIIKRAPADEQVIMLRKLLTHIFETYTDTQDDGYVSDEDIDRYPDSMMPRPRVLLNGAQNIQLQEQPHTPSQPKHSGISHAVEHNLRRVRRVLFPSETEADDEPMPLDDVDLEDGNIFIPNDSPDWIEEPSPDRHLCIHDERNNGCDQYTPPHPHVNIICPANESSGFMSLPDLQDLDALADVHSSSDDELPELINLDIL